MFKKKFKIFTCLILIAGFAHYAEAQQKKSELELILESLEGTPPPTPEIKSDFEMINDEIDAQHQKSVEWAEERKRQERERKLAEARITPTPDPFIDRMDKLSSQLRTLNSESQALLRQISNKVSDLERQKRNFENSITQKRRNKLLTNSDQNWIDGITRSLDSKFNSSLNALNTHIKTLEQNNTDTNNCLTLATNLKNGISNDVASDKQKISNCSSSTTKIEHTLSSTKTAISRFDLDSQYKTNLDAIEATIRRREKEEHQRNFFNK